MAIQPGKHLAKIIEYGATETKAGKPNLFVKFQLSGSTETITWFGSVSEKAVEYTIDALLKLGFKGNDLALLADSNGRHLPMNKEFELNVTEEEFEGKKRLKVRYINVPGERAMKALSKEEAASKLSGFEAHLMAKRQELGVTVEPASNNTDLEDLLF